MTKLFKRSVFICYLLCSPLSYAASGKLLGTAGLNQLEGSGGGGIVPWATLSGYDSDEEWSLNGFMTQVNLDDYRLNVAGVNASFFDRVEVSVARQTFDLSSLGGDISQNIVGLKTRLFGDIVYSPWPQVSVGVQYKTLNDTAIANALGSASTSGSDFYIAATKAHLGALFGYNLVWNVTGRMTKANEMGLLGFGSQSDDNYSLMMETSVGVFLSRKLAVGFEYRQKPDNLNLGESHWRDFFVTYIPSKSFNVTLAWASLGSIAGAPNQDGLYVSIGGQLW